MVWGQAVQNHVAQHGALVIDQGEHNWLLSKILTETNSLAGLVVEHELQRDLSIEILIDADAADHGGEAVLLGWEGEG